MTTEFTLEGSQELLLAGSILCTVNYAVDVEVQYDPGRVSGSVETCYPPSGEITFNVQRLVSVQDSDGNEVAVHPQTHGRILAQINWQTVEAVVWEKFFVEYYKQEDGPEESLEN